MSDHPIVLEEPILVPPHARSTPTPPPGIGEYILRGLGHLLIIITLPISIWFCFKSVQQYEKAVIFRLGRNIDGGVKGPGLFFINPILDKIWKVDLRTITFDVPPQLLLSSDSLSVKVDGVVYYHVSDPLKAVNNVVSYHYSTVLLAQTTLRNVMSHQTLKEALRLREQLSEQIREALDTATDDWGIKIERVELKDVSVPHEMQRALAVEAEAERDARAQVIAAQGEKDAASILRNASAIMMESPASIQLKQLSTLTTIASERDSTMYFPVPVELLPNSSAFNLKKIA